jgi:hypothetical protein
VHCEMMIDPAILRAALLFAGEDDPRTYLNGVRIEADTGGIKAIATDGTRALVAQCANARREPVAFTIERYALESALKLHGKNRRRIRIVYDRPELPDPERPGVTIVGPAIVTIGQVQSMDHESGHYPDWRRVLPETCSGERAQFNADFLADCTKARKLLGAGKRAAIFTIHHNGSGPAVVWLHRDVLAILMPFRDDHSEYIPPEWLNQEIPTEETEQSTPANALQSLQTAASAR